MAPTPVCSDWILPESASDCSALGPWSPSLCAADEAGGQAAGRHAEIHKYTTQLAHGQRELGTEGGWASTGGWRAHRARRGGGSPVRQEGREVEIRALRRWLPSPTRQPLPSARLNHASAAQHVVLTAPIGLHRGVLAH